MSEDEDERYAIHVRGLPWSATKNDIKIFFKGICQIKAGDQGIYFTYTSDERPSGEAYIEMESAEDIQNALNKHKCYMGHRYIEVYRAKSSEMYLAIKYNKAYEAKKLKDVCLRLRGLPFNCSKEEIVKFFAGLVIVPAGIKFLVDSRGRSTGEAYVQFASRAIAEKAMLKHKEKIRHRYIEIFKSNLKVTHSEKISGKTRPSVSFRLGPYDRSNRFISPSPYESNNGSISVRGNSDDEDYGSYFTSEKNRNRYVCDNETKSEYNLSSHEIDNDCSLSYCEDFQRNTRHFVHMRGLPFQATENDIEEFFSPIYLVNIYISFDRNGLSKGEADVEFESHKSATEAMKRDKAPMWYRYIELFLNSTPETQVGSEYDSNNEKSDMGGIRIHNAGSIWAW